MCTFVLVKVRLVEIECAPCSVYELRYFNIADNEAEEEE